MWCHICLQNNIITDANTLSTTWNVNECGLLEQEVHGIWKIWEKRVIDINVSTLASSVHFTTQQFNLGRPNFPVFSQEYVNVLSLFRTKVVL